MPRKYRWADIQAAMVECGEGQQLEILFDSEKERQDAYHAVRRALNRAGWAVGSERWLERAGGFGLRVWRRRPDVAPKGTGVQSIRWVQGGV